MSTLFALNRTITTKENLMMYRVGITIHNCFEVEANNQEEAEFIISSYTNGEIYVAGPLPFRGEILDGCDFNYSYVEEEQS